MLELQVDNQIIYTDEIADETFVIAEIGKIESESNTKVIALHLLMEEKYGVIIFEDGTIEVFGYDPNEPDWEQRVGSSQLLRRKITNQSKGTIQSHYFNRSDGSLLIAEKKSGLSKLINTPFYNADGSLHRINSTWMDNSEVLEELGLSKYFSTSKFSQVAGYKDWLVLSDRSHGGTKGRVVIVSKSAQFELVGEEGNFLGENVWIGGDG